jgi:ParB-like chromosome segregation protein Spo0J
MKKMKLDAIRIDGGTQCRLVIDQPTVYSYLEAMKEGDEFPLMETVFDGSTHWLTDGFHRYHAYKLLGIKEIEVKYKPGTLQDAQIEALKANDKHGKPLTNDDKRNKVEMALKIDGFAQKSNYEIAKICKVSQSFVASIRDPNVKKKQEENNKNRIIKKSKELEKTSENTSGTSTGKPLDEPDPYAGQAPDEDEIKAAELALIADQEAMYKLLEADDALATLHAEVKRLNHLNAQLEVRIHGLMNEKNEAVKMVKQLQKENDKLKGKK